QYTQPLQVRLDPRLLEVTQHDLAEQLAVAQNLAAGLRLSVGAYHAASQKGDQAAAKLKAEFGHEDLRQARLLSGVTQADAAPGAEVVATVAALCRHFNQSVTSWNLQSGVQKLTTQNCGSLNSYMENKKQ
ncbi:MAG: hypothetical protein ACRD1F_11415, partial [Terriglobales bacterium]